jgi:PAS domain S-box-containing protein
VKNTGNKSEAALLNQQSNELIIAHIALQESDAIYKSFINSNSDMIFLKDDQFKHLVANISLAKFYGKTPEEIIGKTDFDLLPKDSALQCQLSDLRVLQSNSIIVTEETSKDHIYETTKFPVALFDNKIGIGGIIKDITEPKRMIEELRQSEDRYRDLVENSYDLLCTHDLNGNFLSINNAAVNITGYSKEEALKMNMRDILLPEYLKIFDAYLIRIKEKGHAKGIIEIKTKSGEKRIWEFNNTLRTSGVAKPIVRGMVKDVTELKSAENVLKKLNSELTISNAEKDKFFSILAHDLRSPFLGFLGLTQDIVKNAGDISAQDLAQIGRTMFQSADNLYKLLQNLLEWAQLQSGHINLELKNISLTDLINANVETMKDRYEQKGISIFNLVTKPVHAFADKKMINSVLLNLLSNAVKFTKRNGTITINSFPSENEMIGISIQDTGVGISQKIIEILFHVGEKTGRKGTDGELSTGLGLLLCKEFIDKNGGKIWVESKEGVGSTFFFTLRSHS